MICIIFQQTLKETYYVCLQVQDFIQGYYYFKRRTCAFFLTLSSSAALCVPPLSETLSSSSCLSVSSDWSAHTHLSQHR